MQSCQANYKLQYMSSFGTHCFWHRGRLFFFTRRRVLQHSSVPLSEREEISMSTSGWDPGVLKDSQSYFSPSWEMAGSEL